MGKLVICLIASSLVATAQEPRTKGAKSLFLDATSGAVAAPQAIRSSTSGPNARSAPADQVVRLSPGLMYFLERAQADGQLQRVNSTAAFHSGDRIRIALKTNTDGHLVISQHSSDGTDSVLFPDARVNGGDNHISAGQFTILPSESSWFRFDNTPGEEKLFILLEPTDVGAMPLANSQTTPIPAEQVASLVEHQAGSKALRIEVDESKDASATYVVRPASKSGQTGFVTAEISLVHH